MKTLLTFLLLFAGITLLAQPGKGPRGEGPRERPKIGVVNGKVVDAISDKPVEFATITMLSQRDSTVVTGGVTDKKGNFLIEEIPVGVYVVQITFIGYDVFEQRAIRLSPRGSTTHEFGTIKLNPSIAALGEAEIVEEKPMMELLMDKRVFNVDEIMGTQGASATEVMETLPSVEVDVDGNISLRGSQNVTVLIDGKPSALTGASRQALLEQIPASSIERIEVITNPSAKYDPDGMTGIINIVLKKNKLQGFHGNVSVAVGTGNQYNGSFGLNYRNKKVNVFTNYSYRSSDRFSIRNTDRISAFEDTEIMLDQAGEGERTRQNHTIKAGTDIYLSPSSTLSFSGNYNIGMGSDRDSVFNDQVYISGDPYSNFRRDTDSNNDREGYDLNASFTRDMAGQDHQLVADFRWSSFEGGSTNDISQTDLFTDQDLFDTFIESEFNENTDESQVLVAQVDYTRPLHGETGKLEVGYKSIVRDLLNSFYGEALDSTSMEVLPQLDRNNTFDYNEGIHALYAQYGRKIGKVSFQGGLRAEQVFTTSILVDTDEMFENDYFSLFPSGYFTYELSQNDEIQLSYSRRINRPRTRQLNPFPNYSDNLNLRRGNPFLLPEYTNSLELTYSYRTKKSQYVVSAYMQDVNDVIRRFTSTDSLGVNTTTYTNFAGMRNYGLELIINTKIAKWWNLSVSGNGYRIENDGTNVESDLATEAYSWSARATSTFRFDKGWQVQLMGFYRAPEIFPQGDFSGFSFLNASVKKSILDNRGSISLNLRDAFDTREFQFSSFGTGFTQEVYRKRQSRFLTFTFSYRFGKLEAGRDRRRGGGGFEGEREGGVDDMMD
ncbi:TonB-dependent receptor domain-containing protein [Sanyastnella coralliicola]|uniref:TonB-dependent receptor domain-containing protein n=1 Tax=Sanyastnella coralliicola TaxID=3069118 RepID=UPI0027B9D455|nr:TonB-dependent receptor [Longitalea sp. SCSIO 12813]